MTETAIVMLSLPFALVGGMVTSTVLTLVVIPVLYFLWRRRELQQSAEVM